MMHSNHRQVLVLQHAKPEHLGSIAEALASERLGFTYLRPDLGQTIPTTLDDFAGLILMGGPQSVYEEDRFPFLKMEKSLTRNAIATNRPVLGVCLGSQILAEVLGAQVRPGIAFELGWKKVTISSETAEDPVLRYLPREITPLHWHGDVYDLPPGAKTIGSSELTPVQGFAFNERFYGLLFHLEVTLGQIAEMAEMFPEDVQRGGTTPEALISEARERTGELSRTGLDVFSRWAAIL